jgi:hypothetical protein
MKNSESPLDQTHLNIEAFELEEEFIPAIIAYIGAWVPTGSEYFKQS